MAFTPQFISRAFDYWPQAGILLATFCIVVAISDAFYAVAASWAAGFLKDPEVQLWSQRRRLGAHSGWCADRLFTN